MIDTNSIHQSWRKTIESALTKVDPDYLKQLDKDQNWLPGPDKIFNAFKQPLEKTKYILFGESPYPREQSANGYAFWDDAVDSIWSESGLSKPVNRATSLRNFVKMLLVANRQLDVDNCTQDAIVGVDKSCFVKSCPELFNNLLDEGFLLLNATPVLSKRLSVSKEFKFWFPFMNHLLECIYEIKPNVELVLWGNIAKKIDSMEISHQFKKQIAEHPYNVSFIQNEAMKDFFSPMNLLRAR